MDRRGVCCLLAEHQGAAWAGGILLFHFGCASCFLLSRESEGYGCGSQRTFVSPHKANITTFATTTAIKTKAISTAITATATTMISKLLFVASAILIVAAGAQRPPRSYCGWAPDNLSESTVCDSMNDCRTGHGFMGCFPRVPATPSPDVPRPSPPSVGYCGWSADNLNIASPCQILDDCVGGHGFMGCFSALPAAALGTAADGPSVVFSKADVQTKSETCIAGSGPCIDGHRTCTSYTRDTDVCPCGTTYRDHSADDGHAACCGDGCPIWRKDFSVLAQLQAFMRTGAELLQARLQQLP